MTFSDYFAYVNNTSAKEKMRESHLVNINLLWKIFQSDTIIKNHLQLRSEVKNLRLIIKQLDKDLFTNNYEIQLVFNNNAN